MLVCLIASSRNVLLLSFLLAVSLFQGKTVDPVKHTNFHIWIGKFSRVCDLDMNCRFFGFGLCRKILLAWMWKWIQEVGVIKMFVMWHRTRRRTGGQFGQVESAVGFNWWRFAGRLRSWYLAGRFCVAVGAIFRSIAQQFCSSAHLSAFRWKNTEMQTVN